MFDMFGVFRGEAQDMHNHTASGHRSPGRKAAKTDINATAAAGAAGGLGALAVANPGFFKQICKNLKERTGGRFDIPLIVAALVTANAVRSTVPAMMTAVFDQVNTNVSSSITVGYSEFQLYNGLLRLAREKVAQNDKAWYNFSGQHELIADGQTQHLPGSSQTAFKHNGMIFMLERNGVTTTKMVANATHTDVVPVQDQSLSSLTVRCFGHSNAPILELFEDVEQMVINGTQLGVTKMVAGSADATTQRSKRLLSTIDLEPELKAKITRDAEIFFSEDSREFYASIGQPYRRGYLLYGPPGTGKTSISVALSSHFNAPLVLLTLKGMSDKDLTDAFSRLPSTCIALIEDVDCAGAEVENRDAKSKGKGKAESSSDPAVALEAAQLEMEQRLSAQQAAAQHQTTQQLDNLKEILGDELGIDLDNYQPIERRTGKPKTPKVTSSAPTNPNAKVSLSCLLNQIDGAAAAEGRLLILTTNCPEVLDTALLRAGRIDEKFKIDFATKVTAELTFKRIFGLDKLNKFKPATIDRFAQAFAAQFPSRSKICTAELAKYCGQYRGRPQAAIEEFADWLKLGDDMFAYRREDLAAVAAEGDFNVPEAFDPALLEVDAQDLADDDAPATTAPLPVIKDLPSGWNPISWFRGGTADDFASVRDELLASSSSAQSTLFDSFSTSGTVTVAVQAACVANSIVWRNTSRLAPFTGFQATLGRADQHPRVFPIADLDNDSDTSTNSANDDTLTWVSPRPIDDTDTVSLSSASSEDIPHISLCDNDSVDDEVLPPLPADAPGDFPSSPPPSPSTPSGYSLRHAITISTSQDVDLDEDEDVFFDAEE